MGISLEKNKLHNDMTMQVQDGVYHNLLIDNYEMLVLVWFFSYVFQFSDTLRVELIGKGLIIFRRVNVDFLIALKLS